MAQAAGAHSSYSEPIGTGGNREDLSDLLWDISPTETPGLTACGRTKSTATAHDYLTDRLEEAGDNAHVEGDDASPVSAAPRIRLSNYTQIFKKHAVVTGTQERVLKGGGIKSEMAYQLGRRMKAMKRDAEFAVFGANTAKVAGTNSTARKMGSFSAYLGDEDGDIELPGNSFISATDGTPPGGDGADAPGAGATKAELTEDMLKAALSQLWNQSGGNDNIIALCGSYNRGVMSEFTSAATRNVSTDDRRLVASIDVYDGDFHTVTITPDRFSLPGNVFLIDPEYLKVADLRAINSYDLAKTGDSYRKEVIWEWTLEVCNPRAHINIADLTTG
jgi:hypothetical protein